MSPPRRQSINHHRFLLVVPLLLILSSAGYAAAAEAGSSHLADLAKAVTLRVESRLCDGFGVGSSVALNATTLVTNRHVVSESRNLAVETSSGNGLAVVDVGESDLRDLGIITLSSRTRKTVHLAKRDALSGDRVVIAGYPQGGAIRIVPGRVVDYVDGEPFGEPGKVMRSSAEAEPGNSGGPVLDQRGHVVGIVFSVELSTGETLAIPASTIAKTLRTPSAFHSPASAPSCQRG